MRDLTDRERGWRRFASSTTPHQISGVRLPDTFLVGQLGDAPERGNRLPLAAASLLSEMQRGAAMGARICQSIFRRPGTAAAGETLALSVVSGGAHDAAEQPLEGFLGDSSADRFEPANQVRTGAVVADGEPSTAAVLVAWASAPTIPAGPRCGTEPAVGRGGYCGHSFAWLSSGGTPG